MTDATEILKRSGWYQGRSIDISKETRELASRGYSISETFNGFYKEFGALSIRSKVEEVERSIRFDIFEVVSFDYDGVIINDYPRIIGCRSLIPVGNINGSSYIAIDECGVIYSLYDGLISIKGKGRAAVDQLITRGWRTFDNLPIPDWWGD